MKVFLIIVGVILISEVCEFILKAIDTILGKKRLRSENELLKTQLETANAIIKHNNEVIEGMARNTSQYKPFYNQMQYGYGCEPKAKVSQDVVDAVHYAMKKSHPDNGGNAEDFMRFKRVYEEVSK